jgi:type IV pilus assembly protein PilC
MTSYSYEAVNAEGLSVKGIIEVASQSQALRRIKQMGLFPTRVREQPADRPTPAARPRPVLARRSARERTGFMWKRGVRARVLMVFTRQLATLIQAGMPLLRGLRILQQQEENRRLQRVIGEVSGAIEAGDSLSQALAAHPRVFSPLYLNLVRAGEVSGALEVVLLRLAQFQEKAQRIKGKVLAAMCYPAAVLLVALGIVTALLVFVVPTFQQVFDGLLGGAALPAFTRLVLKISEVLRTHAPLVFVAALVLGIAVAAAVRTQPGRRVWDTLKLMMPVVGDVFRKVAVARVARTLGTLLGSGVPVLQALNIVKETAGNVVVGRVIDRVQERVKQGDPIAPTLQASGVFPPLVAGMVDVGEQTGALPEMLLKIADNYDDEVDNAVAAMTSLLEPIFIVLLAIIIGSIVIALFLPIITITDLM